MADEQNPHQRAEGEGIAQADRGSIAIVNIQQVGDIRPVQVDPEVVKEAERLLEELPLDRVPVPSPPFPGSVVPPITPNPYLVGREDDLKDLVVKVKGGGTNSVGLARTVAVTGLGGVGKTQLASEFAHRYGQYFRGGVYWLNFSDPDSLTAEVAACGGAGAMRLRPDFDHLSLEQQFREVMSEWQSALPRLLVFDNCENGSSLLACRPTTGGCRVLVTSRGSLGDPALGVISLALEVLSRPQSVELLRKHFRDMIVAETVLDAIAEELGDLPLALDLAGRFLARYRYAVTPSEYVEELRSPELLNHPSLRQVEGISPTGHEMDVGRTFVVSYERLNSSDLTDQLAIKLLARAAHFAPGEVIDRSLLFATVALSEDAPLPQQREDALRRLAELGLLTESENGSLRMHRLVAAFACREIDDEEAQSAVEHAVGNEALGISHRGQPVKQTTLLPHLRYVNNAAREREDYPAGLARYALGISLYELASYDEGRPHMERATKIASTLWGPKHPRTLRVCSDLGAVMKRQGDFDGALRIYTEVLKDQKQNRELGPRHQDVASTLLNVGSLLRERGLYHEMMAHYREALDIREEVLKKTGLENPKRRQLLSDVAESLHNIGAGLMDLGRHREASPHFERALRIYEEDLNDVHQFRYAGTAMKLGSALRAQKDYQGAWTRLEQALTIHREVLREGHDETAKNLINLGTLLKEQADCDKSLSSAERAEALGATRGYLEEALTLSENLYRKDHPIIGGILQVLAAVACAENRREDERSCRERAEEIRERILATVQATTVDNLDKGANALGERGLYEEAVFYQQRSVQVRTETPGKRSLNVATSLFQLARLLQLQGRDEEAAPYLEQALAACEEVLGKGDHLTELVRENLTVLDT